MLCDCNQENLDNFIAFSIKIVYMLAGKWFIQLLFIFVFPAYYVILNIDLIKLYDNVLCMLFFRKYICAYYLIVTTILSAHYQYFPLDLPALLELIISTKTICVIIEVNCIIISLTCVMVENNLFRSG